MSASQEKRRRRSEKTDGLSHKELEQFRQDKKKKRNTILGWAGGGVAVVLVIVVLLLNSNLFYNKTAALQIGDTSYTVAEYNYFYKSNYYNYYGTYESYITAGYLFDPNTPLDEQAYDDDRTWEDFFSESALTTMSQVTLLYDEAVAAGYELSEEDLSEIESSMTTFDYYALYYGYSTTDGYLIANYGKGISRDLVETLLGRTTLAYNYYDDIYAEFEYTSAELEEYYQKYALEKYDTFTFSYYFVSGEKDEDGNVTEEALEEAREKAEALVDGVTSPDEFSENVSNLTDGESEGTSLTYSAANISTYLATYSDWLLDDDRMPGDTNVVQESESGYYALYFTSRDDNHYNMVSVRHLLIKAVADDSGAYTDEAKQDALDYLEELYDEWLAGDADENSFIDLVTEYSEDTASVEDGGLYENIYKGEMVDEFDAFCFDNHKYGDTGIVYGESSGYAGYHLIFYVAQEGLYSDYLAETDLREEDYKAWEAEKLEAYPITKKFSFIFI